MGALEMFIHGGIDVFGDAVGATSAATMGINGTDPISSAAAGAGIGSTIKSVLHEFANRMLSDREKKRINAFSELVIEQISIRLSRGKKIRDDGFFDKIRNRSNAEEIFEGITLVAKKEYVEDKIPLLANLYAYIAFESSISRERAHQLITLAEMLSYQQLELIKIVCDAKNNAFVLKIRNDPSLSPQNQPLFADVFLIYRMSIVHSNSVFLDFANVNPASLMPTQLAIDLYRGMDLFTLDSESIPNNIINEMGKYVFATGTEEVNNIYYALK